MNAIAQIENTPCEVKYLSDNQCQITFTIHQADIYAFQMLFTAFSGLFRNLAHKAKTNINAVHARILENQFKNQTFIEEYENFVCKTFVDFLEDHEGREAFSLTVSTVKEDYPNSSYDQVKQILTNRKYLKKSGFYKFRTH